MTTTPSDPNIAKRVEQFIKLRDKISELETKHKEELAPFKETLEQLSSVLLQHLDTGSVDSVAIKGVGTFYRSTKKSASIADKTAFWTFVSTQGLWDMLDYKANPTVVADYIDTNKTLPPGVNFTTRSTVNVRRS